MKEIIKAGDKFKNVITGIDGRVLRSKNGYITVSNYYDGNLINTRILEERQLLNVLESGFVKRI